MNYKNFYALIFLASCAFAAFYQATSLATYANQNSPLTSPITSPLTSPVTPTPTISISPSPTPSSTPSQNVGNNNNTGSNNTGGTNSGNVTCTNSAPTTSPVITRALTTGVNQVTLFYTTPSGPITSYSVLYGLKSGVYLYGISGISNAQNVISINGLTKGQTYFFKVSAVNGCASSPASQEISIKLGSSTYSKTLGVKTATNIALPFNNKVKSIKPAISKPVASQPQNKSFILRLLSFFN